MPPALLWRLAEPSDLPAMIAIADAVHPAFPEDDAIVTERLRLYPQGVRLLEVDGRAMGYLVSHPWPLGTAPTLNSLLGQIPAEADSYYLHDLALLPEARGTGAAGQIVEAMAGHAREAGFATMSLIAVNGSIPFWQRLGFAVEDAEHLAEKLRSYEDAARLMIRPL